MAIPQGTFKTYETVGIREDLTDRIYNVDPYDTPFMTSIGRESAEQTKHEWQTDALAAANTSNAVLEGDDATLETSVASVRLFNICQISDKTAVISGTNEVVRKAGRQREMAYQLSKRSKELRIDCESILLNNQALTAGGAAVARTLGGLPAWLETNTDGSSTTGTTGSQGTTAATDSSTADQRALTETMIKNVSQSVYTESGTGMNMLLMAAPFNKRQIAKFVGTEVTVSSSTRRTNQDVSGKRLVDSIDYYVTDFHELRVVPNRFQRARDVFLINPEYLAVGYLRGFRQWPLSKTGDSEKRQILVEYTLCVKNEKAHGFVRDLTTS